MALDPMSPTPHGWCCFTVCVPHYHTHTHLIINNVYASKQKNNPNHSLGILKKMLLRSINDLTMPFRLVTTIDYLKVKF